MLHHLTCERCGTSFDCRHNDVRQWPPLPKFCSGSCASLTAWDRRGRKPPQERFWAKVQKTDTCWLWMAVRHHAKSYGQFKYEGRMVQAHVLAYTWLAGPVPKGLELDHLCRVRWCVNPAHLEPVPPLVNGLRGIGPHAVNARKTSCIHGHPFDEANTYIGTNRHGRPTRVCRICRREVDRRRRHD